jgi:hypothetical protein
MWERINAHKVLIETPERRRPLRRPMCRLEYNIKMGDK